MRASPSPSPDQVRSGESNIEAAPLARLQLRAGQLVYAQGEPASSFYIVSRGELQAVFTSSSGEHATLRSYTAGDQFGYDAMFSERYDTSVTAKTDVELIAVPKELVQYAIASDDYFQVTECSHAPYSPGAQPAPPTRA